MLKKLCYYNNPILRTKALPIEEITKEIRALAYDMFETMIHYKGVGIAANQVGALLRIFVSNVEGEDEQGNILFLKTPMFFINPVLTLPSQEIVRDYEGCLSIPGLKVLVPRPKSIHVRATDLEGAVFEKVCTGFLARVIMHENDHLNGVLYIDKISSKEKKKIASQLEWIIKNYNT